MRRSLGAFHLLACGCLAASTASSPGADLYELRVSGTVSVINGTPGAPWDQVRPGSELELVMCVDRDAVRIHPTAFDQTGYADPFRSTRLTIGGVSAQGTSTNGSYSVYDGYDDSDGVWAEGSIPEGPDFFWRLGGPTTLWQTLAMPSCDSLSPVSRFTQSRDGRITLPSGTIRFNVTAVACSEDAPCAEVCPRCPADFNSDGGVDGGDVESFFVTWEAGLSCADVDGTGGVDGGDVESFFTAWEGGSPGCCPTPPPVSGDYNGDGVFSFRDRFAFLVDFSEGAADVNCDGRTDAFDRAAFLTAFCDWDRSGALTCEDICAVTRAVQASDPRVDFNFDESIDQNDIDQFIFEFVFVYTGPPCVGCP